MGRLQAYGMATWDCFRTPPGHAAYLSLQEVLALATEVAGEDHGFRWVNHWVHVAVHAKCTLASVQEVPGVLQS